MTRAMLGVVPYGGKVPYNMSLVKPDRVLMFFLVFPKCRLCGLPVIFGSDVFFNSTS